jgi:ABC-type dipeptide/oligopeptide/nickel transport system ATPase component
MVKVYKHFNKPYEIFLGLSITKLIQIIIVMGITLWIFISLGLSPQSPLSLIILIPLLLCFAVIIKSQDDYYLRLLTHPFQDHLYLINRKTKHYPNLIDKINIKKISDSIIYKKDYSLSQIMRINHGISIQNLSNDELRELLNTWSGFLSQYNKISNFEDYFSKLFDKELLEFFIHIDKESLEQKYYLIIHQEALNEDKSKLEKILVKILQKLKLSPSNSYYTYKKEFNLLQEKIAYCQNYFNSLKLSTHLLNDNEIKNLISKELDIFTSKAKVKDKGNHLELKQTKNSSTEYIKTYTLKLAPDSGELDFWLKELVLRIHTEAFISIKLEYRDPDQDRKKAESKASILSELKKAKRASTQSVIKDNKALSETLINKPYSYNLSIGITIKTNSIEELKNFDRIIQRPIKNCEWSPEARKQINSLISNLPSSKQNKVSYKHYADLDFATANFCFFASNFPKDSKYYIGKSLSDNNPINLNEANTKLHKTRSINFIGDSGSGKSLLAKSMLIKRLQDPKNKFIIIDNTQDGWTDFTEALGGVLINLNKACPVNNAYFNPFYIEEKLENQELNQKILSLMNFFNALCDQEKLTLEDKDFLGKSLRTFLLKNIKASLSDLYLFWSNWENRELATKWQSLIATYCHVTNGAYAYLLDGKAYSYNNQLQLFQFSTINQERSFSDICFYLINNEIEKKAQSQESKITLIIDEAWRLMQSQKARDFLSYYARAGRAIECALWTISQKPSDLTKDIYSSASVNISFHLKEKSDQEKLKTLVGFEEHELKLFTNNLLKARGNCIIKSSYGTDLVKVMINDDKKIICSSEKDLLNARKEFQKLATRIYQ